MIAQIIRLPFHPCEVVVCGVLKKSAVGVYFVSEWESNLSSRGTRCFQRWSVCFPIRERLLSRAGRILEKSWAVSYIVIWVALE